jgi:hypothetical protein
MELIGVMNKTELGKYAVESWIVAAWSALKIKERENLTACNLASARSGSVRHRPIRSGRGFRVVASLSRTF